MPTMTESPATQDHVLAAEILAVLNDGVEREDAILNSIPLLEDPEDIIQVRLTAVDRMAWRSEIACDAALVVAVNAQLGGKGVRAELKKKAKEAQTDVSTVYRNGQIYSTFFSAKARRRSLNVQTVLKEKGFYEAALRTPSPLKAIKIFADEKSQNPSYGVRDALRQIRGLRKPRGIPDLGPDSPDYLDPHYKTFLLDLESTLSSFRNRCPREQFLVRIDSWLRQVKYERHRTPGSDYLAVRDEVDKLASVLEEIQEEVLLSFDEIKRICELIVEKEPETYEWRPVGCNTKFARGGRAHGIFRVDAPSGDDFTLPRAANRYENNNGDGDDEDDDFDGDAL